MNAPTPQTYTLEILAEITGVSARTILLYQEHGIIHSDFNDETVRALRRIVHLRDTCKMNLSGLKMLSSLLEEVEQLREELRSIR